MAAFVTILLLSNVLGAGKVAMVDLPGIGALAVRRRHPLLSDLLCDRRRADRGLWLCPRPALHLGGLLRALLFMAFMAWVVVALPPAASWTGQAAYEQVFGQVPRIVFASIIAFWAGEFVNSYVLARMKLWTKGRHLWTRTIGSTLAGQGVDSLIFYPLAFYGVWDNETCSDRPAHAMGAEGRLGGAADPGHLCSSSAG